MDKLINWIWSRRYMNRCMRNMDTYHVFVGSSCLSIYISTSTRTYLLRTQMYIIYPNKHWPLHSFTHLPETFLSARNQEKNHLATIKKEVCIQCRWNSCGHELSGKQNDMKTHKLLPLSIPPRSIQGAQVERQHLVITADEGPILQATAVPNPVGHKR